jgi:hypothetical protein
MNIVGKFSFNDPKRIIETQYTDELAEIEKAIRMVDAYQHHDKVSKEKTMRDRILYSPVRLNKAFHDIFYSMGWKNKRVKCDYPTQYYLDGYNSPPLAKGAFRDMDYVKNGVGVEVQFGKYSFMVYNVSAKMTIFYKLGIIKVGIEIVPVKELANEMSSGVSYFEQFLWDLEKRGTSNIDIPVLVLGIKS